MNLTAMDGTCDYSSICGRNALDGHEGKCILHSGDISEIEEGDFMQALIEHYETEGPNFEQMAFPAGVSLPFNRYEERANFRHATFEGASFNDAEFEGGADFSFATFKRREGLGNPSSPGGGIAFITSTVFTGATFGQEARFHKTVFEDDIILDRATFEDDADFTDTTFEGRSSFVGTTFKEDSFFVRTSFEKEVQFITDTFEGDAYFTQADFGVQDVQVSEYGSRISGDFEGRLFFSGATFRKKTDIKDISPKQICFDKCRIWGSLTIVGSKGYTFKGSRVELTDLDLRETSNLRIKNVDLSRCRLEDTDVRKIDFVGVKWCEEVSDGEWFRRVGLWAEVKESRKQRTLLDILRTSVERMGSPDRPHWTLFEVEEDSNEERWSEVERLYRQLKRNHEQRGDFPRGGDFHIGEKEARRKSSETSTPLTFLLYAYRAFSKYGERAIPAALSLLVVVVGCAMFYSLFDATLVEEAAGETLGITDPEGPLTLSESLRVSLEASFYPVRPIGFKDLGPYILGVIQRLFSPFLLALLALALRQRVKR